MSDSTANPAELPIPADHKRCSKCKEVKPLTEFYAHPGATCGYKSRCKICYSTGYGHKPLPVKPKPRYLPEIDAIEISLTKGYVAIIDMMDADLIDFKWQAAVSHRVYAQRTEVRDGKQRAVLLHRVILSRMIGRSIESKEQVDHIDLDGLNCRRQNLRLATNAENNRNKKVRRDSSSGIKGVHHDIKNRKWIAMIRIDGKLKHLGSFNTAEEASSAYKEAAKKYHGEFARFE